MVTVQFWDKQNVTFQCHVTPHSDYQNCIYKHHENEGYKTAAASKSHGMAMRHEGIQRKMKADAGCLYTKQKRAGPTYRRLSNLQSHSEHPEEKICNVRTGNRTLTVQFTSCHLLLLP